MYDGVLICGVTAQSAGPLSKWPGATPRLPYHVDPSGYRGQLSPDAIRLAFARAWAYWAEVAEIYPELADSPPGALIRTHFAAIDGPSNVLAWSELANDDSGPKTQRFDAGESWVVTPNQDTPTGGIDLVRVACHEIGHVLGLEHDAANAEALMRPSYSTSIARPTARDVQRLIGLGYRKRTAPVPKPNPTPDPPPVVPPPPPAPVSGLVGVDTARRVVYLPTGWSAERSA